MSFKQDYIARLIEEFARVLGVMFSLRQEGKALELQKAVEKAMNDFTGIAFNSVADLETSQVIPFLKEQKSLNKEHWIIIGELLNLAGESEIEKQNSDIGIAYLSKALEIFRFIAKIETKIFSVQHNQRLLALEDRLEQLTAK